MSDVDYIALAFEPHGNVTVPVEAARCPDCGSERYRHHRSDVVAERDRLAQELEGAIGKLKAFADGVDEHWTPDLNRDKNCTCVIHRLQREAREFLARFPVREGDGDDS